MLQVQLPLQRERTTAQVSFLTRPDHAALFSNQRWSLPRKMSVDSHHICGSTLSVNCDSIISGSQYLHFTLSRWSMSVMWIKGWKWSSTERVFLRGGIRKVARKALPSTCVVLKGNVTGVYAFAELLSSITCSEIAIRPLNDCRL